MADMALAPEVAVQALPPTDDAATTAPVVVDPAQQLNDDIAKRLREELDQARRVREDHITTWQTNIDYRRCKATSDEADENRKPISADWVMSKGKIAQLFSQLPVIVASGEGQYKIAAPTYEKRVNYWMRESKVGAAIDEVLADVVNAAGIGGVICWMEALTTIKQVPQLDPQALTPEQQAGLLDGSFQIPMINQQVVTDRRFPVERISPGDLLIPPSFVGSDYDTAAWLGRTGRLLWTEAQRKFNLKPEDRQKVTGHQESRDQSLRADIDEKDRQNTDMVTFDELFYWAYKYRSDAQSFKLIYHLVIVRGIDKPVIHEPWKGQQWNPQLNRYVGACKLPIRILTTTYVSDDAHPPSDTAVGRVHVQKLIEARDQHTEQRRHSKPARWFDVNRVDPDVQTQLMGGDWQGMIPVQGDGSRAIGEVARSAYPREEFEFERAERQSLQEVWMVGPNQMGSMASGERSAAEAKITQNNFSTRVGQERSRVVNFIIGIADVLGGLLTLYDDFNIPNLPPEEAQAFQGAWDRQSVGHEIAFSIRGDATVLLDAEQQIDRITRLIDLTAKSGYLDVKPLIEKLVALSGEDPRLVVKDPNPPAPDGSNISYRFSGEDLGNPTVIAILMRTNQAPTPEEIEAAKKLLQTAGMVTDPVAPVASGLPAPTAGQDMAPNWELANRVRKRTESGE